MQIPGLAAGNAVKLSASPFRRNGHRLLAAALVLALPLAGEVDAQRPCRIGRGGGLPGAGAKDQAPPGVPAGMPSFLSKSMAINATIGALAINNSDASQQTLEKIVTGEIQLGGHAKEGAQLVILQFAMQPSRAKNAFLKRLLTDPDEKVRPAGDKVYPAAALRFDVVNVLGKLASPELRLALAKIATQAGTQADVRATIESVLSAPLPANFPAQVEIFRSATVSAALKQELQKTLLVQNASAAKQALRLEQGPKSNGTENAAAAAALGSLLRTVMGGSKPAASGGPGKGALPPGGMPGSNPAGGPPGAAMPTAASMLDVMSKMQNQQPVDAGMVAHELWSQESIESILQVIQQVKSQNANSDISQLIAALASVPLNAAREKLQDLLKEGWTNGPDKFAKFATSTAASEASLAGSKFGKKDDAPAGGGLHGRLGAPGVLGGSPQTSAIKQPTEFAANWFDPGSLIVMKTTIPYEDRPKEKHRSHAGGSGYGYGNGGWGNRGGHLSAAAEKKAKEKAEKEKLQESKYQWRTAIELAIRGWNKRFDGSAETADSSGGSGNGFSKSFGTDEKESAASDDSAKPHAKDAKKSGSTPKITPAAEPAPKPAVPMPFALHAGGTISKEYHAQWPQDLPSSLSAAVPDPLVVHYIRLAGNASPGKILSHYHTAVTQLPSVKWKMRELSDGKWFDAIQRDRGAEKTRSIDVVATWEETADEKGKKSQPGDVTVEILVVEIKALASEDATPAKKQVAAKSSSHRKPAED